ncbi:MAG: BolA family protein [Pseudomonadota bacterium]
MALDRENRNTPPSATVRERINTRLEETFAPRSLDVVDESHLHAGHVGARPEGETHFRVTIVADAFSGKTRVASHRMINEALSDFLAGPVHALALQASAPKP